jgi:hypothetical protein
VSTRFTPGGWVEISRDGLDAIYTQYGIFLEKGPHQIHSVNLLQGFLRFEKAGILLDVGLDCCIVVDAPKLTAAQKERAAMDSEPWRRRRDENLTEVFKPKPYEAPDVPAPKTSTPIRRGKTAVYRQSDDGHIYISYEPE